MKSVQSHPSAALLDVANKPRSRGISLRARLGVATWCRGCDWTDETLALMAAKGTFFDPTVGVVTENYVANKDKYLGVGNYTAEAFAMMEKLITNPKPPEELVRSLKVPGLKIVYGSDATAGAHGHNAEGLLYPLKSGGQDAMQALVSATSLAAESLNLGSEIGAIAPGMTADLVAMRGDFLADATALRQMAFVMTGGRVFKYQP